MRELVSVIVPIYNVGDYLEECIQSIVNQTYQNLEIILVDDGSTDNSLSICQKYQIQDKRIKLIYQDNSGVGVARNNGLSHASGDYIIFVDSDDWLDDSYIANLVKQQQKYDSDIAVGMLAEFKNSEYYFSIDPQPHDIRYDGCYSNQEWMKAVLRMRNILSGAVWGRLFRRSLFYNVAFPVDMRTCEDTATIWQLELEAKRISFQNSGSYYIYRQGRSDSIVSTNVSLIASDKVKVLEARISLMHCYHLDTDYLEQRYYEWLKKLEKSSLNSGNYREYQQTIYKLRMIDKYSKKSGKH